MPLPFESSQLRKLIELAYLGEWMVNAHHDPEHQDDAATAAVQSLLEAAGKVSGVGRDVETSEFYLEEAWTEQLYTDYIGDYDDHIFWDELTERLAQRDLARRRGVATEEVNRDDDLAELKPLEDHYRRELESNGLDHLELGSGS